MVRCNEVVKKQTIKVKERNLKVEHKNLHGNCQYAGLWDREKCLVTIDSNLSPEDTEMVKVHEVGIHTACDYYTQVLVDMCTYKGHDCPATVKKVCAAVSLSKFSDAIDHDPLLFYVLPMYGIGLKLHPKGLKEWVACILWGIGFWMLKKLSLMRGRAQGFF